MRQHLVKYLWMYFTVVCYLKTFVFMKKVLMKISSYGNAFITIIVISRSFSAMLLWLVSQFVKNHELKGACSYLQWGMFWVFSSSWFPCASDGGNVVLYNNENKIKSHWVLNTWVFFPFSIWCYFNPKPQMTNGASISACEPGNADSSYICYWGESGCWP